MCPCYSRAKTRVIGVHGGRGGGGRWCHCLSVIYCIPPSPPLLLKGLACLVDIGYMTGFGLTNFKRSRNLNCII